MAIHLNEGCKNAVEDCLSRREASIPSFCRLLEVPRSTLLNVTSIPSQSGILSADELDITENYSASELCKLIANGNLTSERVTLAFLKRACIAQQLVNCLTEAMFESALSRAREMDRILATTGSTVGPLHGLPISLKEHILMKSKITHSSFVAFTSDIAPANAFLLDCVLEAGAVPFVRTPQPQSVMHLETNNNIYGHTLNPFNRSLTSGGSSGGEGALLGLKGSVLGIGSDIGGSIRNPASLNGVYGFKPTTFRLPAGTKGLNKGRESIVSTMGPLARSREDLAMFMKAIIDRQPWLREPSLIPIPWREISDKELSQSNITVAVMYDDGVVNPLPPIQRALSELVEKLEHSGIKVIEWKPWRHVKSWDLMSKLYFANGAKADLEKFKEGGEGILPLTQWLFDQTHEHTHTELNQLLIDRNEYKTQYANHWLDQEQANGSRIDVILSPVGPGPAPKLETSKYWTYTSVWNLLDYPAVSFPVTTTLVTDTVKSNGPKYGNAAETEIWDAYKPEDFLDAPISLQLCGRRFEDERVLKALQIIESAIESVKS